MVLLAIGTILLLVLSWLLLARIVIDINSTVHRYEIRWWGLVRTSWHPDRPGLPLRIGIPGWSREKKLTDLLTAPKSTQPEKEKKPAKKRRSLSPRRLLRLFRRLLRSFRVREFYLRIHSDNAYYNGLLYPLNYSFPGWRKRVEVSFQGDPALIFRAENRLIRMLYYLFT